MAIAFNCPHCQFAYNLPDKLAGKQAKCKNPECRKLITIPAAAVIIPPHLLRGPSTAMVERLALDALSDEPPKVADVPAQEKVISMICSFCEHKWTEPWAKAGKNTLCPNPECRQRQRIPEPKEDVPTDWRQARSKLPSLAKDAHQKLEGVQDAADVKGISGKAAQEAGLFDDLIDPRPIKDYVILGLGIFAVFAGLIFSIWYLRSSRIDSKEDQLMADARKEFDAKAVPELSPVGAGLSSAVLNVAAAEYELEKTLEKRDAKRLKDAQEFFDKGRNDLRKQPPGLDRYAVAAEFALAVFAFAGTEEQVKEQFRYRWQPDESMRTLRLNERTHTIHQELSTTLQLLQGSDVEFRLTTARRLTRALVKHGQAGLAADLLPVAMFSDSENAEARAMIALEIYRADRNSPVARQIADDLKVTLAGTIRGNPHPASAQTLFTVLAMEKTPLVAAAPPPSGPVQLSHVVLAQVGVLLLKDESDAAAIALAMRAVQPDVQLKALTLCAEWARDPGPALDAAAAVISKSGKQTTLPPSNILRLSQLAAIAGKHEQAGTFADTLADDGLKAWAKGESVRLRIAGKPNERADEGWILVPDDPKKVRAGHAWGLMWVARANAKESHDPTKEKKATVNWPATVHPFALAGIALGLQDK